MANDSGMVPDSGGGDVLSELHEIKQHLKRIDNRDRLRMVGGFFRSIIALIPIAILIWSTWYFIEHGDEFLKTISKQAAEAAASMAKDNPGAFLPQEQINGMLENPAVQQIIQQMMAGSGSATAN